MYLYKIEHLIEVSPGKYDFVFWGSIRSIRRTFRELRNFVLEHGLICEVFRLKGFEGKRCKVIRSVEVHFDGKINNIHSWKEGEY